MNASLYIVCIFLIFTSNLNISSPKYINRYVEPSKNDQFIDDEVNDKLLQQSIQLLHKWITSRTDRLLAKIVDIDSSLHQTIHNNQQSNVYKFEAMSQAIDALREHLNECKKIQEEVTNQKADVANCMKHIRNMQESVATIESKLEKNNITLNKQIIAVEDVLNILAEKMKQYEQIDQELKTFKQQSDKDVSALSVQLDKQEVLIGKLMDSAMSSSKKSNELQQKMQQNMDAVTKSINSLKNQLDEQKSASRGLVDDRSDVLRREIHANERRISREMSVVDVRLTNLVQSLNRTLLTNNNVTVGGLDSVKKSIKSVADDLSVVKITGKNVNEYQEKIVGELYSQKQEVTKLGAVLSVLRKDVDVLLSYAARDAPMPTNPTRHKNKRNM